MAVRRVHGYGYTSYRGRSGARTALLIIIALLLVVLLLSVAVHFVLQKYVVYTDDGQARVELPFLAEREPVPTPAPDDPMVLVTEGPMASDDPLATPQPEVVEQEPLFAVRLPRTALTDGSAAEAVAAAGGNAALFDMKGDDGFLAYVSALPEAVNLGTSAADSRINDGVRILNDTDLYTVARISCFRDNRVPRMDNSLAIRTTGGYNWFDPQDLRWVDPGNPYIQNYLAGVCRELAQLGFDEILLDWAAYPAEGELNIIRRPEGQTQADRTAALESFYTAVETALADFPEVKLSITARPAALAGEVDESGQNSGLLAQFAQRIYVSAGNYAAGLEQAGLGTGQLVLTSAPEGYSFDVSAPVLPGDTGGIVLPLN